MRLFYLMVPIFMSLVPLGCKDEGLPPPPNEETQLKLEALDASCTEVWLKVSLPSGIEPRTIRLRRDTVEILTATLLSSDTTIVDEGLLPNSGFMYMATRSIASGEEGVTASITTLDTTSHDFTWQIDTLGDGNSSVLYDVAIINDTLVYAVGEISIRDSAGNWINPPYNIAKWNGQRWELMRRLWDCRLYYPNCGPTFFSYSPVRSIYAFGPNDIWIAAGTAQHWNGVQWTEHAGIEGVGGAYKIWGTSSNDLYFVGYGGFIVHKSGGTWLRVESGTAIPLNDVWGGSNRMAGENIVLIPGSDNFTLSERKILRVKQSGAVDSLIWGTVYLRPESIWFDRNEVFVTGDRLFRLWHDGTWKVIPTPSIFLDRVRGMARNDLLIVGDFGIVLHYNGISVHEYPEVSLSPGIYRSVAVSRSLAIAVGWLGACAVAVTGRR